MPTTWLAKVRLVGERLTAGAVPVPVRLTLCGLPVALSVRVTDCGARSTRGGRKGHADRAVGLLPHTELPHVLVWAKSLGLVPVSAMLVMLKAALPVLFRVMV